MVKKSNNKRAAKNNIKQASLAEKTEQILLTMPKIIATQIGKDLVIHAQQENKCKAELKKLALQKNTLSQKIIAFKKKNTSAAKKQAAATQKLLQKTLQLISDQTRQLEAIQKQLQLLSQKKAKYMALQAQLLSFQKDWNKKMSKKTSSVKKPKIQAKNKPISQKSVSKKPMRTKTPAYPHETQVQETRVLEIIEVPVQDREDLTQDQVESVN